MALSILLIYSVGYFAAFGLSRVFFKHRPDFAILLSPALLIVVWTFAAASAVIQQIPLNLLWAPLWAVTASGAAIGAVLAFRNRQQFDLPILLVPVLAAPVLMAPYLINGLATFPGSYFWDGFAYMAAGESLWLRPRNSNVSGLELFYQFGQGVAKTRYVSSSFIALMKGVFPFRGDAQAAMGYFLLLCIFIFASSCCFLAKAAMPGRRSAQIVFVIVATVSGPLLNLVWANNYDHLLAASIAPVILGLAFLLRWGRASDAVLIGLFSAALLYIYPEMAAIFALPAGLILLVRLIREERSIDQAKSVAIAVGVVTILVIPAWPDLVAFMQNQIAAATKALTAEARPGNGYFPTFFSGVCGPATWLGMFQPYARCNYNFSDYTRLAVSIGCWAIFAAAILSWRKNVALIIAASIIVAGAAFFLIVQRYDYGAFKILETGWVPLLLLATLGMIDSGRTAKLAASVATALVLISVARVASFDRWVAVKSITPFAKLQTAIPPGAIAEVRVEDSLAFEWATYYLRDHRAVYTKGELPYYPASEVNKSSDKGRVANAEFLVTDQQQRADAIWSNKTFYLYALKESCGHNPCASDSDVASPVVTRGTSIE